MTEEGYKKLQVELKDLVNKQRPEIIEAIAEARSHGDLSENAEYQYAKEQQSLIEGKIAELDSTIAHAEIIDVTKLSGKEIKFGAIIKIARKLDVKPEVVWTVGSSGTLSRGLQLAWLDAKFHCVQTGHKMEQHEVGKATIHPVKYKFDQACKEEELPPFPSAREYDAKVWKPMLENYDDTKINLFWNVAGDL